MLYFMNLIANITEKAAVLKHFTPFGFCDGAEVANAGNRQHGNHNHNLIHCMPPVSYFLHYSLNRLEFQVLSVVILLSFLDRR